ncbi:hypothetical protein PoB_006055400 [Plakobranchus ocellatus]|uniref:Secreted protein n=1 Tax=Plakobranchus ocellatus TaxID=259542 RepID=A0AAV4CQA9_9GAST|nr:hypothetical protein PoB_006055400 [Plakobranchus ocellatus]
MLYVLVLLTAYPSTLDSRYIHHHWTHDISITTGLTLYPSPLDSRYIHHHWTHDRSITTGVSEESRAPCISCCSVAHSTVCLQKSSVRRFFSQHTVSALRTIS